MSDGWKITGVVLLVIAAVLGLSLFLTGWKAITAPFTGWAEAEQQIESAESRRYNYNWFFNKCASIRSMQQKIENTKRTLENTEDPEQRQMYRQNLLGLQNQLDQAINDYNATSAKHYTAARFKDKDLPKRIERGEKVQCE